MRTAPGRAGEALPAIVAALFPILFIPTLTDAYILPRASLAIAGGCLLFGWGLVATGPGLGPLGRAALAVAAAAILAAVFSVSPLLSVVGSYARYESLLTRLSYLALFAGTAWLARTPASRQWTLTGFVFGCVLASIEAVYEAATGYPPRPDGNLGQSNLLGALLAMAIPIVCSRVPRAPLWIAALVPLVAGAVVSSSRSGWLGAIAGTVLVLPLLATSTRRRVILLAGAAGTMVLLLGAIAFSPLSSLNGDSGSARLHVWRDSIPLIAARPLTGYGEDALGLVFGRYLTGNWEPGATFDRIHQEELDLLATQGVLGLAACTWLFGVWLLACWRRAWSRALPVETVVVAVLGAWAGYFVVVQLNFDWVPATGPLWLLAGVGWAAIVERKPSRRLPAWTSVTAISALAALALAFGLLPILADERASRGDATAAATLDPIQAHYHRLLGERGSYSSDQPTLREARAQLLLAAELGEYDATVYIELGDVDVRLGDPATARAAYTTAIELDPYNATARQRLRQTDEK